MNILGFTVNIALIGVLIAASLFLFSVDAYALHGTLFVGASRYLLVLSLLSLAGFAIAVVQGRIRGNVSRPPPSPFRWAPFYVDPVYKGELLVRYWYFIASALIFLTLAFAFSKDAPNTALNLTTLVTAAAWL